MGVYMKLSSVLAVATAVSGLSAMPAFAQQAPVPAPAAPVDPQSTSGFYVGGGINLYFLDRDYAAEGLPIYFDDQPSPGDNRGKLGYAFNDNIAIDLEAGFGGARSKFTTSGGGTDGEIGIETPLGAHLVLTAPMNGYYLMGKIGYVSAKISREYLGYSPPDLDVDGVSFGIGGGVRSGPWDYRMEYSFMSGGDSGDGGVLGMSILHHF
jgi:hypothetical protein